MLSSTKLLQATCRYYTLSVVVYESLHTLSNFWVAEQYYRTSPTVPMLQYEEVWTTCHAYWSYGYLLQGSVYSYMASTVQLDIPVADFAHLTCGVILNRNMDTKKDLLWFRLFARNVCNSHLVQRCSFSSYSFVFN